MKYFPTGSFVWLTSDCGFYSYQGKFKNCQEYENGNIMQNTNLM